MMNLKHDLINLITKLVLIYFVILILFPINLFKVAFYDLKTAFIALASFAFLLPSVLFLSKSYWKNKITIIVWVLRIFALVIFLIVGFEKGIGDIDLLSLGGTIIITFFYELGYFIVSSGHFEYFLKAWVWISTIICIYLLYFATPLFLKNYLPSDIWPIIRDNYHNAWPNQFAIYLVLTFLMVIYLSQQNKKYGLLLVIILPTLFLTFARTAFVVLFVGVFLIFSRRKWSFLHIVSAIIITTILIAIGIGIFTLKSTTEGEYIGHTIDMRIVRWDSVLSVWQESPLLGIGFRSLSMNIPYYTDLTTGEIAPLGSTHNDYVDLLIRGGIIYSIIFWAFIIFIARKGFQIMNYNKDLSRYLSYSIIIILLVAFTQNPFKDAVTASIFWIYSAAISYYSKQ